MSLQTVLSFINIVPGSAGDEFVNQVQSLIGSLYGGSSTLRAALDDRVVSGIPLNISFVPGAMQNFSFEYLGLNTDIIKIDPAYTNQFLLINQYGQTLARGFSYMFTHEFSHALFGYSDPNLDDLNTVGFDFLGDNVRSENLILSELGITDARIGYFSSFSEDVDYQQSYTGGSIVDYAFKNDFGFAFVDASQSMQKDERGLLIGSISSDSFTGGYGSDWLWGLGGTDVLSGGVGNDTIIGGEGSDQLFGGAGDDFIFFDADDSVVDGGAGIDAAWVVSNSGVTADMTAMNIEILTGGGGNDTLTVGDGAGVMMVAGGAGADTIIVNYGSGQDTRVLWGGDDAAADVFDFVHTGEATSISMQLGILVATVTGLTAASFASFNLSMLNLSANFDWSSIDAVILNPGSDDKVNMWGSAIDTSSYTEEVYGLISKGREYADDVTGVVTSVTFATATEGQSTYLGDSLHMQAPDYDVVDAAWYRKATGAGTSFLNGMESGAEAIDDFLAQQPSPDASWQVNMSGYDTYGAGVGLFWHTPAEWEGQPRASAQWFVAGGAFNDQSLAAVDAPTAVIPVTAGDSIEWLLG